MYTIRRLSPTLPTSLSVSFSLDFYSANNMYFMRFQHFLIVKMAFLYFLNNFFCFESIIVFKVHKYTFIFFIFMLPQYIFINAPFLPVDYSTGSRWWLSGSYTMDAVVQPRQFWLPHHPAAVVVRMAINSNICNFRGFNASR